MAADLPPGWTVVSSAVEGGQARLFRARRSDDTREYALKLLRNPKRSARFTREVATMQLLRGLGVQEIPEVIESGKTRRGTSYYVTPWCSAGSLQDHIDQADAVDVPHRLNLLEQVAVALQKVHQARVAHRDIKPDNILIGDDSQVLLADFGLCLQVDDDSYGRQTAAWEDVGPRHYIAPEMETGKREDADHRPADFWSFGKMLWVVLTGEIPRPHREQLEPAHKLGNSDPRLSVLDQLSARLLETNPAARLQDWTDVIASLRAARQAVEGVPGLEDLPERSELNDDLVDAIGLLRVNPRVLEEQRKNLAASNDLAYYEELTALGHRTATAIFAGQVETLNRQLGDAVWAVISSGGPSVDDLIRSERLRAISDLLEVDYSNARFTDHHANPLFHFEIPGGGKAEYLVMYGLWLVASGNQVQPLLMPALHRSGTGYRDAAGWPPSVTSRYSRVFAAAPLASADATTQVRLAGESIGHLAFKLFRDAVHVMETSEVSAVDAWVAIGDENNQVQGPLAGDASA